MQCRTLPFNSCNRPWTLSQCCLARTLFHTMKSFTTSGNTSMGHKFCPKSTNNFLLAHSRFLGLKPNFIWYCFWATQFSQDKIVWPLYHLLVRSLISRVCSNSYHRSDLRVFDFIFYFFWFGVVVNALT